MEHALPEPVIAFHEWSGVSWKWFRLKQEIRRRMPTTKRGPEKVVFVVGCQRSGATMMIRLLQRDPHAKVYNEHGPLSTGDKVEGMRLDPLDTIVAIIARDRAKLVVLKPIVESQNTPELVAHFPGSKALWFYRNYRDVAASNLVKFGIDSGIRDLKKILGGKPGEWRGERISDEMRGLIEKYFSDEMKPHDAAALFWLTRNRYFFDRNLAANPQVLMCRYEDLVRAPAAYLRKIYNCIDADYPGDQVVSDVHAASIQKGEEVDISPEIVELCEAELRKLEETYKNQERC